ncbi:MAG: hypothetical protein GY719_10225 [bacterium]|nr:hypothetical protein [bacterium]
MQIAIGHSIDPLIPAATEEIVDQVRSRLDGAPPKGGLLFACRDADHEQILEAVTSAFPAMPLIGCTTDGELSSVLDFQEDSILLVVFAGDGLEVRVGLGRGLSDSVAGAVQDALGQAQLAADPGPQLCITIPESLTASGASIVNELVARLGPDIPLVGGTAGDQWHFEETRQFIGREVYSDSVPVLLLCGAVQVGVGVASGWEPVGPRGLVTRAEGHVVHEISDQPALEFFQRFHGPHVEPNPEYPLGVFDADRREHYLRAPLSYDRASGSVGFAGDVPVGSEVQITDASRDEILTACEDSIKKASTALGGVDPDGVLVFSCAARKQLLGTRTAEEAALLRDLATGLPMAGFYTYGEIAPIGGRTCADLHNETFVTVLLGEGAAS